MTLAVVVVVGWGGLLGTLGLSDGSFSLPQDDVDESADQRQREGDPRQDVGVAEGALLRHPVRTHHRIDDGSAHHEQTCSEEENDARSIIRSYFSAGLCSCVLCPGMNPVCPAEAGRSVFPRRHPSTLHHSVSCLSTSTSSSSSSSSLSSPFPALPTSMV